jgi:hemolysin activation/secretion protein
VAWLAAGLLASPALAQNFPAIAPNQPAAATPTALPAAPMPSTVAPNGTAVIIPGLKGVAFIANASEIKAEGVAQPGVSVGNIALLQTPGFTDSITPFLGQPLTLDKLNDLTRQVLNFYRAHQHPLVDVVVPEQNLDQGTVQIVVTEFRVGEVKVEGNKWFTKEQVAAAISYQHGDLVNSGKLLTELDTANANPFRHVDLIYQPGAQPGYTDLILATQDQFPLRVYGSYDNNGTPSTGRDRWSAGFNWGNAFWADQQLSYQFTTSSDYWHKRTVPPGEPNDPSFVGHSATWTIPFASGQSLTIFGAYEQSVPNVGGAFGLVGRSNQISARYDFPLPGKPNFTEGLELGYDFKSTNNNLDFGGTTVSNNVSEIDQFLLGYSTLLGDSLGSTSLNATVVWSPGGMTGDNSNFAFQPSGGSGGRPNATANYAYVRAELDRLTKLPLNTTWALRVIGQATNKALLDTEQLSAGGADVLRGYDPNSINGDSGIIISNELRTPTFNLLTGGRAGQVQLLTFLDYAAMVDNKVPTGGVDSIHALSTGFGARYNFSSHVDVKFDYGWQLEHLPGEGHLGEFASLSLIIGY